MRIHFFVVLPLACTLLLLRALRGASAAKDIEAISKLFSGNIYTFMGYQEDMPPWANRSVRPVRPSYTQPARSYGWSKYLEQERKAREEQREREIILAQKFYHDDWRPKSLVASGPPDIRIAYKGDYDETGLAIDKRRSVRSTVYVYTILSVFLYWALMLTHLMVH